MNTRTGETTSLQISYMGVISDIDTQDFTIENTAFLIKNDGDEAVELSVYLENMDLSGSAIATSFAPGWNPELVKKIVHDSNLTDVDIKYGY